MRAFDASSIIHAWDHYPIVQFPSLWNWLGERIAAGDPCMCEVAMGEVKKRAPDCHAWLCEHGIKSVVITNAALIKASDIEARLGIANQRYNRAGVGENDILIIASAFDAGHELISNEARQDDWRKIMNFAKYKIPTVCDLDEVAVPCSNFLQFIKGSRVVFDSGKR